MLVIISFIKILVFCIRKFTPYSATALPGLIIEKYFPHEAKRLYSQLEKVVVVTGTNGKTTTVRMICHLLKQNKIPYLTNHHGSNMNRGLLSTLVDHCDWSGNLTTKLGVLEVEEATLPRIARFLKIGTIVVTNIYRDQLDAYGEIDKTLEYLVSGVKEARNPALVLNADDLRVMSLAKHTSGPVYSIGFDKEYKAKFKDENKGESGLKADFAITHIKTNSDLSNSFEVVQKGKVAYSIVEPIPGIYNCYSATASTLAVSTLIGDISPEFNNLAPAFGRGEKIFFGESEFIILLGKNPAGLNLNLDLLGSLISIEAVLLMLNDNIADGSDVSWIWDSTFPPELKTKLKESSIYVCGTRKFDMALRLKYEGFSNLEVCDSTESAIKKIASKKFGQVYVLPTYTAMLDFRKEIGKLTKIKRIHE